MLRDRGVVRRVMTLMAYDTATLSSLWDAFKLPRIIPCYFSNDLPPYIIQNLLLDHQCKQECPRTSGTCVVI